MAGLASHGAKVYMGARDELKALRSIQDIKTQVPNAQVHFLSVDLSSLHDIVSAAVKLRSVEPVLHGLVNNAGVMGVPFSLTADGYEVQFQVSSVHTLIRPWRGLDISFRGSNSHNMLYRPTTFPTGS